MNIDTDTVKTAKLPRSTFSNFARYKYRSYFSRKKNKFPATTVSSVVNRCSKAHVLISYRLYQWIVVIFDTDWVFFWSRNSFALRPQPTRRTSWIL